MHDIDRQSGTPTIHQTADAIVLRSMQDASVNMATPTADGGFLESRYVQRTAEYFICYLSSHSGCNRACRFCHLTATRQTMMSPATADDYHDQATRVLDHYDALRTDGHAAVDRVHFNLMARGEPLDNPAMLDGSAAIFERLQGRARMSGIDKVRFKVSSIVPNDFTGQLDRALEHPDAVFYYSLYSMNPSFRKRWLPKAMCAQRALDKVADHQARTGKPVVLHWALISGENDGLEDVGVVIDAIRRRGIRAKFNLVRYNPHDGRHGVESSDERRAEVFAMLGGAMSLPSRIVSRVGFDVAASCGMFIVPGTAESNA